MDVQDFDEALLDDPRSTRACVGNARNELHFALHKVTDPAEAVALVNALAELDRWWERTEA